MSVCVSTVSRCWRNSRATSRPPIVRALPSTTWVIMHVRCATYRRPAAGSPQVSGRAGPGRAGLRLEQRKPRQEDQGRANTSSRQALSSYLRLLIHPSIIHPPSPKVFSPCSSNISPGSSHHWELNPEPHACKASTLPTRLHPQGIDPSVPLSTHRQWP